MSNLYYCEPCGFRAKNREEWIAHMRTTKHRKELDKHESSPIIDGPVWETGFLLQKSNSKQFSTQWVALYEKDPSLTRSEFKFKLDRLLKEQEELTNEIKMLLSYEIAGPKY